MHVQEEVVQGKGGAGMSTGLQFEEEASRRVEAVYSTPATLCGPAASGTASLGASSR